jgi:hypothetical protein
VNLEKEPIELRFGERISALLLDGVSRRKDLERIGQRVGRRSDGDLALLHGLEQRSLRLRWRPVDLVGQNEVGENRPLQEPKSPPHAIRIALRLRLLKDIGSGDVGWQEVGGELNAAEGKIERLRQRGHQQCLREPRHTDEQRVATRRERHEHRLDDILLPHDSLGDRAAQPLGGFCRLLEEGRIGACSGQVGGGGHGASF